MSKNYCCIYNGLGNQLFGYALGMHISKKYNKELHIDLTKLNLINFLSKVGIKKDSRRNYELHKLGFVHPVKQFNHLEFTRNIKLLRRKKSKRHIIADFRQSYYNLDIKSSNQNIYTIGWGGINIIQNILPELRRCLSPNFEITPKIANTLELINKKNAVAIHVRRTDYINSKTGNRFGGICTETYYENAIRYIKKHLEDPYFIIFSDDVTYVRNNPLFTNSHIVTGNKGYIDLYLLSQCKHFILANSTFSFWGAILNDSKQKIVCIPEYWYNNPLENETYLPKEWVKVSIS